MRKVSLPLIVLTCFGALIALGSLLAAAADTWRITAPAAISAQTKIAFSDEPNRGLTTNDVSPGMTKLFKSIINGIGLAILEEMAGVEAIPEPNGQYSYLVHTNKGILPTIDLAMNTVTDIPISGAAYIASGLQNIGLDIAPPAQAQGYGYVSLTIFQSVWRSFRNVAYVFFTLVILIVGFMILFQQKLDGTLVLTVQKALPRIILSLILVTFSYAIAGLLIDVMYLAMFLVGSVFRWSGDGLSKMMNKSILGVMGDIMGGSMGGFWRLYGYGNATIFGNMVDDWASQNYLSGLNGIIATILFAILGLLVSIIFSVILFFASIGATWKLFKSLLKSYVIIIFNVIFAPIQLMLGALPSGNFTKKWFNSMIGNIAPFVGLFVMLTVSQLLYAIETGSDTLGMTPNNTGIVGQASAQSYLFSPPFMAGEINSNSAAALALTCAQLGLLLAMPEIVETIKKKFGAESGFLGEVVKAATDRVKESAKGTGGRVAGSATMVAAGAALPALGDRVANSSLATNLSAAPPGTLRRAAGNMLQRPNRNAVEGWLSSTGLVPGRDSGGPWLGSAWRSGARRGQTNIPKIFNAGEEFQKYTEQKSNDRLSYDNYVGQAKKIYDKWKTDPNPVNQSKSASAGEWLDQYAQDKDAPNPINRYFKVWFTTGKRPPPLS